MIDANKVTRISTPQFRMLSRLLRGEHLPRSRYRREHSTVAALLKKKCVDASLHGDVPTWSITKLGIDTHSRQGRRGQRHVVDDLFTAADVYIGSIADTRTRR
jgi:hypothetical protein